MDVQPGDEVTISGVVKAVTYFADQDILPQYTVVTAGSQTVIIVRPTDILRSYGNEEASI